MSLSFDHLVIGAQSLAQGLAYVQERLGISMPLGGKHPRMGTHNHLLQLDSQSFLEVIAIDPEATSPARRRWFGLDEPELQADLAHKPRLIHWVVGTPDLTKSIKRSSLNLGKAEEMSRGDLQWLISIREDGALLEHGLVPTLIQWPEGPHPAGKMLGAGLALKEIQLHHPDPVDLRKYLDEIEASHLVKILPSSGGKAHLKALFCSDQGKELLLV